MASCRLCRASPDSISIRCLAVSPISRPATTFFSRKSKTAATRLRRISIIRWPPSWSGRGRCRFNPRRLLGFSPAFRSWYCWPAPPFWRRWAIGRSPIAPCFARRPFTPCCGAGQIHVFLVLAALCRELLLLQVARAIVLSMIAAISLAVFALPKPRRTFGALALVAACFTLPPRFFKMPHAWTAADWTAQFQDIVSRPGVDEKAARFITRTLARLESPTERAAALRDLREPPTIVARFPVGDKKRAGPSVL
jgi:hypothetical protein